MGTGTSLGDGSWWEEWGAGLVPHWGEPEWLCRSADAASLPDVICERGAQRRGSSEGK